MIAQKAKICVRYMVLDCKILIRYSGNLVERFRKVCKTSLQRNLFNFLKPYKKVTRLSNENLAIHYSMYLIQILAFCVVLKEKRSWNQFVILISNFNAVLSKSAKRGFILNWFKNKHGNLAIS